MLSRKPLGYRVVRQAGEGWSVAGDSYSEVRALVDAGVEFVLDRADVAVEHFVPADTALSA